MDNVIDEKRKAALKKYLRDFPWLWAILQKWHHWSVAIFVQYLTGAELGKSINFSLANAQLWLKGKNYMMGRDTPSEQIVNCTPKEGNHSIADLLYKYKASSPLDVEYVILVFDSEEEGKKLFTIYRPPASQKVW
jgi:hypothetical protein